MKKFPSHEDHHKPRLPDPIVATNSLHGCVGGWGSPKIPHSSRGSATQQSLKTTNLTLPVTCLVIVAIPFPEQDSILNM
ncbi:hypothetical protein TNCV_3276031 [Trichonephila clavipes]|nr:hypothetical protein TNCV_3276031 [Trichonephila clavipes]